MSTTIHPNAIRVGFVGLSSTGWASLALAPSLLRPNLASSFDLVAVSTTSATSAEASAKKYSDLVGHPVKAYYGDVSSIANDPDVDLIAVSVRAAGHKAAVLRAIEAGKDVFVEWPAGIGLKESSEIAEAAKAKGVRTMVGLQGRQSPVTKKLKEILASGKIGKVFSSSIIAATPLEAYSCGPKVSVETAYSVDHASGTTMFHVAIGHQMDTFTHLLGDFATVSATSARQFSTAAVVDSEGKPTGKIVPFTTPNQVAFTGLLKSGAVASVAWHSGLPYAKGGKQYMWTIDGEHGSIRVEGDELLSSFTQYVDSELYLNGELVELEHTKSPVDSPAEAWAAFAQGEGYATMEDAARNHRLLDAIMRSVEEGKTIKL